MQLLFNCILYIIFIILAFAAIITFKVTLRKQNIKFLKNNGEITYSFKQIFQFLLVRFTFIEIILVRKNRFKISHLLSFAILLLFSLLFQKSFYWSWSINLICCVIFFIMIEVYLSQSQQQKNQEVQESPLYSSRKTIIYGIYTMCTVLIYTNCCYLVYYQDRNPNFLYLSLLPALIFDQIFARPIILIFVVLLRNQFSSILLLKQAEDLLDASQLQNIQKQTNMSILPVLNDQYKRRIQILSPSKRLRTDTIQTDQNLIEPKPTLINNLSTDMQSMINFLEQSQKRRVHRSKFNLSLNTGCRNGDQFRMKTNKNNIDNSMSEYTDRKNNSGEQLRFKTSRYINEFYEKKDMNRIMKGKNQNNHSITQSKIDQIQDMNNPINIINQTQHEASKKCISNQNLSKDNQNEQNQLPIQNTFSVKDGLITIIQEHNQLNNNYLNMHKQRHVNSSANQDNLNKDCQDSINKSQKQLNNELCNNKNRQIQNDKNRGYISQVIIYNSQQNNERQYKSIINNNSSQKENTRYSLLKIPQQIQIQELSQLNLNTNKNNITIKQQSLFQNKILTDKKNISKYFSTNFQQVSSLKNPRTNRNNLSQLNRQRSQRLKPLNVSKVYSKSITNKINNQNICPYQQSDY